MRKARSLSKQAGTLVMWLLWAVFFCGVARPVAAQEASSAVQYDSSAVAVRQPAPDALEAYRSDPVFQYEQRTESFGWFGRALRWLRHLLSASLPEGNAVRWFIYLLAALGMAYTIMRLLKMPPQRLFRGGDASTSPDVAGLDREKETADFGALLEASVQEGAYRRAVRLLYLRALQRLAARGLIHWLPGKTNHDYARALRTSDLHAPFVRLTALFERAWYGDARVDRTAYERIHRHFARFHEQIQRVKRDA